MLSARRRAGRLPFTVRVQDASGVRAGAVLRLPLRAPRGLPDGGTVTDGGTTTDGGDGRGACPLKVGNWNIEWFGDTDATGRPTSTLQLTNVRAVLADAGADVWGAGGDRRTRRSSTRSRRRLPGYDGFLANDCARVRAAPPTTTAGEQKLGVLFKSDVVQRAERRGHPRRPATSTSPGGPPLRVDLRVTGQRRQRGPDGIVLHMKAFARRGRLQPAQGAAACAQGATWTRSCPRARHGAGRLERRRGHVHRHGPAPAATCPRPSRTSSSDPARLHLPHPAAVAGGLGSTVSYTHVIDHQLVTNELAASYVADSTRRAASRPSPATARPPPTTTPSSAASTSARCEARSVKVTAPNGGETLSAGTTFAITWTASDVVAGEAAVLAGRRTDVARRGDDRGGGRAGATRGRCRARPPPAARVRVSDATDADVADLSDDAVHAEPARAAGVHQRVPAPAQQQARDGPRRTTTSSSWSSQHGAARRWT